MTIPAGAVGRKPSLRRGDSGSGRASPTASSSSQPIPNGTHRPRKASGSVSASSVIFSEDDDRGLVMRERDKNDSIGKSGGVDVGVTRPKRRLSSLPSLPHPAQSLLNELHPNRAYSSSNPSPSAPNGYTNGHHSSSYKALHSGLSTSLAFSKMDEKTASTGYVVTPTKEKEGPPSLFGIELKWISLITLALQNAFLTIIMHYSRISVAPAKAYSAASAVLLNEILKGSISVFIALHRITPESPQPSISEKSRLRLSQPPVPRRYPLLHSARLKALGNAIFSPDCYKLSVPAILYVIQNNLQYVAASNLDVATFQVTYQMKILTTAFFSVLLLRKRLSKGKWAALVLLAIGVAIVQLQSTSAPSHSAPQAESGVRVAKAQLRSEIPDVSEIIDLDEVPLLPSAVNVMHPFRGFIAVTLACMTSGLAGVYFEYILKSSSSTSSTPPPDLWVRNAQLSLFSIIPALVPILVNPPGSGAGWLGRVMASFSNFNGWAIGTVLTQTFGGLITAVVIRYSDNIMKGFATSLSIIISFLASVALFSYPITVSFVFGSTIVLLSTFLYNSTSSNAPSPSTPTTRREVAVQPGSPIGSRAPIIGEPEQPSRVSSVVSMLGLQSAKTSLSDLRNAANTSNLALTPSHVYAASAPGTPYISSGYPSSASIMEGRVSPGLHLPPPRARSPSKGGALGISGTGRNSTSSTSSSGSSPPRPTLRIDLTSPIVS